MMLSKLLSVTTVVVVVAMSVVDDDLSMIVISSVVGSRRVVVVVTSVSGSVTVWRAVVVRVRVFVHTTNVRLVRGVVEKACEPKK